MDHFQDEINDIGAKAVRCVTLKHLSLPILQRRVNVGNKFTQIVIFDQCLVLHFCTQQNQFCFELALLIRCFDRLQLLLGFEDSEAVFEVIKVAFELAGQAS